MIKRMKFPTRSRKPIARSTKPIARRVRPPKVNARRKAKREKRYKAHLSSAYWKNLRREIWVTTERPMCEQCGESVEYEDYQLGHLTYARFGHEWPEDVAIQHKWCNAREAALRGKRIRRSA